MNYELQGIGDRLYYAFLCIAWRQSTDLSHRVYIAQQRNQKYDQEK